MDPPPLTPEVVEKCWRLRKAGLLLIEIAHITGLPRPVVYKLLAAPAWPKKVTRIYEDGTWEILTDP